MLLYTDSINILCIAYLLFLFQGYDIKFMGYIY